MSYQLTVSGLDRILAGAQNADHIIDEELAAGMTVVGLEGERLMKARIEEVGAVDRAQLVRSPTHQVAAVHGGVRAVVGIITGPASQYAKTVDQGRRPGAAPPPTQAIAAWLRRKGSSAPAFKVAQNIGRRGIAARPFVEPTAHALKPVLHTRILEAVHKAVGRIAGGG